MRKFLMCIVILSCVFSCKKDDPIDCEEQPEEEQWERFVGDYVVYDTLDNYLYDMSISHFYSDGSNTDSILIENYGNRFNIRSKFNTTIDKNYLSIDPINPIEDFQERRWYFWSNNELPDTDFRDNYLQNDTIHLSYLLDNTPYYLEDGVPFENCECREVAVKQNWN